jgi:hypothetical protein
MGVEPSDQGDKQSVESMIVQSVKSKKTRAR